MWPWGSGLFLADNGRNEKPRPLQHAGAIVCCDVFNSGSFRIFSSYWRPLTVFLFWGGWRFWREMAPERRPQHGTRGAASSVVDAVLKRGNWNLPRKEFSVPIFCSFYFECVVKSRKGQDGVKCKLRWLWMLQQESVLKVCGGVGSVSIGRFGLEPSSWRMVSETLSTKDRWEKQFLFQLYF